MKHFTTKFLAVCALVAVVGSVQAQVFYTQLFDTPGLPTGWTTADPSGNDVLWQKCNDADTDCHGDLTDFGFEIYDGTDKANGFMVMDSDGGGQLPNASPHQSQLTSAAINCADKSQVFISFEHYIGVFGLIGEATANARLFVSNNGTSWTPFQVFGDLTGNGNNRFSANPTVSVIDISSVAANQATVYLRWEWIGNFEFAWCLDKVELASDDITPPLPDHNLAISDFFYPVSNYATPEAHMGIDTFAFFAYISNLGAVTQTNIKLYAYVAQYDDLGAFQGIVHIDSVSVPALAPGVVDSVIEIESLFAPELAPGLYSVIYEVVADSLDSDDSDNFEGDFFQVTENLFSKESGPQVGYQPGPDGDWAVGNYYRLGPSLDEFVASAVEFTYAVNAPQLMEDIAVELTLFKINDDVADDFSNFELDGSSMTFIGTAPFETPAGTEDYDLLTAPLIDLSTAEEGVLLEPNGRYLLSAGYTGASNTAFHAWNENVNAGSENNAGFISTLLFIEGEWGGNFEGRPNPVLRMYLNLETISDNSPLVETALTVFPNPTADYVNLQVKFEQATDATITIADINGRVVRTENRAAMLDETVKYQVSNLAAGTYLARIATEKGTRTLKFVVQK